MVRMTIVVLQVSFILSLTTCKSVNKPYNYKHFPNNYTDIHRDYTRYYHLTNCKSGETIASIGAGNGIKEIQISCFIEDITWYLQEIDSSRLYQFNQVLDYHNDLVQIAINADFNLVLGTETSTGLPEGIFERVLMLNVFHEIESRTGIMLEIHKLLNQKGKLIIMERMAEKAGEIHGDCKYPKLLEPVFLQEMNDYGFSLVRQHLGEKMSNLRFYVFELRS